MNNNKRKNFKQKINKDLELDFITSDKAFLPTGTSGLLIEAVKDKIIPSGSLLGLRVRDRCCWDFFSETWKNYKSLISFRCKRRGN